MTAISARPRIPILLCGLLSAGIGLVYLYAAGAPMLYLAVNLAAAILGVASWFALGRTAASGVANAGPAILGLALLLLLTALFGRAVEGASRWISLGSLTLQVSLILLPVMLVLYARRPDAIGTAGMVAASLALALQPDRAMAAVQAASQIALLWSTGGRLVLPAMAASIAAFGWTLLAPDTLPAVPHVDRILYTSFDVHPLAGLAVAVGAAALGLPALILAARAEGARPALLAFGACWAAIAAASALGNYPTPVVGYGGSAVLGYLLSAALLPTGALRAGAVGKPVASGTAERSSDRLRSELHAPVSLLHRPGFGGIHWPAGG